jgi:hypothetical protein
LNNIIISQDAFRKPKWIFGGLILIFALSNIIQGYYTFIPLALLGTSLLLMSSGLEIDLEHKRYRLFKSIARRRSGEWQPFRDYTTIIILSKQGSKFRLGPKLAYEHETKMLEYQVFLTDQNHRKRLYLKHFDTEEQARKYALSFMEKTGIPLERYNPVISEETRNRR